VKLRRGNLTLTLAVVLTSWAIAADPPPATSVSADDALARLKAGNERFANSKISAGKPVAARRAETAQDREGAIATPGRDQCRSSKIFYTERTNNSSARSAARSATPQSILDREISSHSEDWTKVQ
jgi:hypothetical protein